MTRVLTFDGPKAAKRFALLRLALLSAGDAKGDRTRATIRQEARLFDALDPVSDPAPDPADPEARVLNTNGGRGTTVTISQEDFDLLSKYVDTCPWVPRAARDAVDLQDWLSTAAKVDS